ncbi:unnamed protein product [Medioppia subpectinata]|uniref:Zinc finger protein-like 1 homolog n=1 Tax=Medioppia subpectinata TaxID=1979941 RepID=A0A7R9PZM6_9ACAR|nr:unnamed protein product [Medioppia subpectinata]CAG2107170.1 unnamed protein product [Medioppia subpectinata]
MYCCYCDCIVAPYLQWLEDSAYEPVCGLCRQDLSSQPTIRLLCYHIYHLSCLTQSANTLPANTAPAGYTCPACLKPIFPSQATNSPVVSALRRTLSDESWARIGLGMPLIESSNDASYTDLNQSSLSNQSLDMSSTFNSSVPQVIHHNPTANNSSNHSIPVNVSNYSNSDTNSAFSSTRTNSKSYDNNGSRKSLLDIDEDKYRRKSPMEFLSRWLRSHSTFSNRRNLPTFTYRPLIVIGILVFIGLCTLVHYFLKFGRESADSDPLLDPRFNPNIRNEHMDR